jgi:hypothetical protein
LAGFLTRSTLAWRRGSRVGRVVRFGDGDGDDGRIRYYSGKEDMQEDEREINLQKFFYW